MNNIIILISMIIKTPANNVVLILLKSKAHHAPSYSMGLCPKYISELKQQYNIYVGLNRYLHQRICQKYRTISYLHNRCIYLRKIAAENINIAANASSSPLQRD